MLVGSVLTLFFPLRGERICIVVHGPSASGESVPCLSAPSRGRGADRSTGSRGGRPDEHRAAPSRVVQAPFFICSRRWTSARTERPRPTVILVRGIRNSSNSKNASNHARGRPTQRSCGQHTLVRFVLVARGCRFRVQTRQQTRIARTVQFGQIRRWSRERGYQCVFTMPESI